MPCFTKNKPFQNNLSYILILPLFSFRYLFFITSLYTHVYFPLSNTLFYTFYSLSSSTSLLPLHKKMIRIKIFPKTLLFKQPAGTSRGIYTTRKVWYLAVNDSNLKDSIGFGECAPLFDLSCDYNDEYEMTLLSLCKHTEALGYIDYDTLKDYPSILFGFETAFKHLYHQSFKLWDSSLTNDNMGIPINGLVWMGSHDEMMCRMHEKANNGFRCIKIKIGAIDFNQELHIIESVRKSFNRQKIELRLDANGGFTPEEALSKLQQLSSYNIHSVEQPIKQHQWEEMAHICQMSPIPIALDEELIGVNETDDKIALLDTIQPQYIILKPSLHGGFKGCEEWIDLAQKRNIGYWITSALESNIGLNAIAQWCASFNPSIPQGLGTGSLFTDNVPLPLTIKGDALFIDTDKFPSNEDILNWIKQ